MVLYSKYKDNEKHGITCFLKMGAPWLIQEWNHGTFDSETLLVRKGADFVAVDDAQQLLQAHTRLSAIEKDVAETETDLKKSLGKWFADEKSRITKEKEKVLTKVALAQHEARRQRITTEEDAEVAAAHTHLYGKDRVGRVAAVEEGFAAKGLKAANKSVKPSLARRSTN